MSRIHNSRDGWTLDTGYEDDFIFAGPYAVPLGPAQWLLSMRMTGAQYSRLAYDEPGNRGYPAVYSHPGGGGYVWVERIRVTDGEAREIANGRPPLDVLFPVWPEYGYRLAVIPADLSGRS